MRKQPKKIKTHEQIAVNVSIHCIIANVLLTVFKLLAGIIGNSVAMVSDAVHTLSDTLSNIIVIVGVKMGNKHADKEHPYGHERMESVAALILAALLFVTGAGIGWAGVQRIIASSSNSLLVPGVLALIAALVSIAVKEGMYWYARIMAKRINSSVLMADAWHHRSDALSSVGSFAGIFGARLGLPILDPAVCVIICFFIIKTAFDIAKDSIGQMTDRAWNDESTEQIREAIMAQEAVIGIDQLKTRLFGDRIYVDVEIRADGNHSLSKAHEIAQRVHDAIEEGFPMVKHCMVHVNPVENEESFKNQ
jgi:cation diffusion facilitator family transporter